MSYIHEMQKLQQLAEQNGPLCVGLDTDPSYIPQNILSNYKSAPEAVLAYNRAIIKRVSEEKSACCFKVQIAYYEAMGLEGLKVFSETLKAIRETGLSVISDIKRGDIGATSDAYAKAHFSGDFETDIITVNPYMGFDTLKPFTLYANPDKGSKGMFVLLCTSNPGMTDIEKSELKEGGCVFDKVGAELSNISAEFKTVYPEQTCSPVGAVVGCTHEEEARTIREQYKDIFFLIPGYGAQGGAARIAATLLLHAGGTVNSSRGILCAWKKDPLLTEKISSDILTLDDITDSAARAAIASKKDLLDAKSLIK